MNEETYYTKKERKYSVVIKKGLHLNIIKSIITKIKRNENENRNTNRKITEKNGTKEESKCNIQKPKSMENTKRTTNRKRTNRQRGQRNTK